MNDNLKLSVSSFVLFLFLILYAIPYHVEGKLPTLMPKILAFSLLIPCALFLYEGLKSKKYKNLNKNNFKFKLSKLFFLLILVFLYAFTINIVGFVVVSFLFMIIFLRFFGEKNFLPLFIYPIALPLGLYLLLEKFLNFPLPDGILF
jgi:putative tricarboxylic transport membrane protein